MCGKTGDIDIGKKTAAVADVENTMPVVVAKP